MSGIRSVYTISPLLHPLWAWRVSKELPSRGAPFFAVAAMIGLRPGEVLGLSTKDLDFDTKHIFVRRSAWHSQLLAPKSQRSAGVVPMPALLEEKLRSHLRRWVPNPKRLLFCHRRNNRSSENKVVQKRLWPVLDELKIPRCGNARISSRARSAVFGERCVAEDGSGTIAAR